MNGQVGDEVIPIGNIAIRQASLYGSGELVGIITRVHERYYGFSLNVTVEWRNDHVNEYRLVGEVDGESVSGCGVALVDDGESLWE